VNDARLFRGSRFGGFTGFGVGSFAGFEGFDTGRFAGFGIGRFAGFDAGRFAVFGVGRFAGFGAGRFADFGVGRFAGFGVGRFADFFTSFSLSRGLLESFLPPTRPRGLKAFENGFLDPVPREDLLGFLSPPTRDRFFGFLDPEFFPLSLLSAEPTFRSRSPSRLRVTGRDFFRPRPSLFLAINHPQGEDVQAQQVQE